VTEVQFQARSERLSDETRIVRVCGELDLFALNGAAP
jgi:hypothetical protein